MGHALSFKYIFDEIESDIKQQYYPDIAFQYGKLIKLILDFEAIDDATLIASIPGMDPTQGQVLLDQVKNYINSAAEVF